MDKQELLRIIEQTAKDRATALDLSNRGLTELPPEIGNLTSLKILNLENNQLSSLPPEIGNLTNLEDLHVGRNQISKLPDKFRKLVTLKELDLTSNQFSEFPGEIVELPNLKYLFFSANLLTTLPSDISKLTKLKTLYLDANQFTTIPPDIGKLTNLTWLNLNVNQLSNLPLEIEKLSNLTHLNLKSNPLPIPYEIMILTDEPDKIITYYLRHTTKNEATNSQQWYDLSRGTELQQILEQAAKHKVKFLDLSNKQLTTLPPEIGELTDLTELDLSYNHLTTIPKEIQKLTKLLRLDLKFNQFTAFPSEIENLTNLTFLHLGANQLMTIPSHIEKLMNLRVIKLWHNKLITLPLEISKLKNLTGLSLAYNQITTLPKEIEKLTNLKSLNLKDNPLPIPPEILALRKEPAKILNYYFQHQAQQKKPLNEAKVLIVGQGAVGKTSLIKRLLEDKFDPYQTKTDGIAINQWHIPIPSTSSGRTDDIRLNVWDFGGQEIMHATHQFFLTKRSLYLLVLDSRLDDRQNQVEYWLKIIQSFGGDSPIIVVCNKCDEHSLDLNWKGLQEKYPTIKAFAKSISCKTGDGIAELRGLIEQEVGQLEHIHDELILSWFAVKTQLEEMQADYIAYHQYQAMCQAEKISDELSQQTLLGFLHDLGIVLHFHDHPILEETNVLNPEWVTKGIYQILNSNELFQNKGELARKALNRMLDPQCYPRLKQQFILDMMRKFELCFDFAEQAGERFLLPDLLAKEEPYTGEWDESLAFQYHYDILPGSVISRFMVRMHAYIYKKTYWRNGVVLISEDNQNRALVKADLEDKKMFIAMAGSKETRSTFLAIIRADFRKIHATIPKLAVKEVIPLPGHPGVEIDYQDLLKLRERGIKTYYYPKADAEIDVGQLLDSIGAPSPIPSHQGRGTDSSSPIPSHQGRGIESPLPLWEGQGEGADHTYFLSYSWNNSSEADHLELVLKRDNRKVLRDETNIAAGKSISKGVEMMIQQADTFVALWNEHYANSTWCPNELEYARNRQAKGQKPTRIVLLTLDETEVPIRFVDTLRLTGHEREQRELAIHKLLKEEG